MGELYLLLLLLLLLLQGSVCRHVSDGSLLVPRGILPAVGPSCCRPRQTESCPRSPVKTDHLLPPRLGYVASTARVLANQAEAIVDR